MIAKSSTIVELLVLTVALTYMRHPSCHAICVVVAGDMRMRMYKARARARVCVCAGDRTMRFEFALYP